MAGKRTACGEFQIREAVVREIEKRLPKSSVLGPLAGTYKALGHPSRLAILHILALEECCVCELACILAQPFSTVSQHLRVLRQAGVVQTRQEGKLIFYSLADGEIRNLLVGFSLKKGKGQNP
ncbi:MAG: ArsR/SmtB family transcription factor [Planctomycetota bacterium]|jgi:ArsR family transcriptional regulator